MDEDSRTIWCGNLSENVSEEILYELFLQAGPLQSVRIPKSKDGRNRAFGFITYKHQCSVPYALAMFEGTELFRRELRLQSRNPDRIQLEILKSSGRDGHHNRSQSLPVNLGFPQNAGGSVTNFDSLLLLGQNFMKNFALMGSPPPAYHSQSGASPYLGGQYQPESPLSTRSLQGNWSSRNHPYDRNNGNQRRYGNNRSHR